MKPRLWVYSTLLVFFIFRISSLESHKRKSRKLNGWTRKIRHKNSTLTRKEWEELHKFEDALKSEDGKLFFTNSWAVQLDPAELEVADRLAEKHGFENLGQVSRMDRS
jgi:hypothetical protein